MTKYIPHTPDPNARLRHARAVAKADVYFNNKVKDALMELYFIAVFALIFAMLILIKGIL